MYVSVYVRVRVRVCVHVCAHRRESTRGGAADKRPLWLPFVVAIIGVPLLLPLFAFLSVLSSASSSVLPLGSAAPFCGA